jgi:hypothetical protein
MPLPFKTISANPQDFSTLFPAFGISYNAPINFQSDNQIERAVDGTGRGRSFWQQAKGAIAATIPVMTESEATELITFFNNNMATPFGFPWGCPQVWYSVVFDGAPSITPLGAGLYTASFTVTIFP